MFDFPIRYYIKGAAYAGSIAAGSYEQARKRCSQMGWKLEEDAARAAVKSDGYA